jgi:hypothetical protein
MTGSLGVQDQNAYQLQKTWVSKTADMFTKPAPFVMRKKNKAARYRSAASGGQSSENLQQEHPHRSRAAFFREHNAGITRPI